MADKYLLLVEGKNEEHVFGHLFRRYGISEGRIEIKNKEGIANLLESLPVELKASELERLGVVVDADVDIAARWQALRDILLKSGYDAVPKDPLLEGTIIQQEGKPLVGIWIMPDNRTSGMLEDFISFLVPQNDPLWSKAADCLEEIPEGDRRFTHPIKAHIHTWLAWQREPGTPFGGAIARRYLDADAPQAQQLMNWIKQLFDLQA
ncbi:MAG: hypothetical protein L0229_11865 [Blastocatellia bacterium]|nr:hypothetical protein [Blastocatellia bacterium]